MLLTLSPGTRQNLPHSKVLRISLLVARRNWE